MPAGTWQMDDCCDCDGCATVSTCPPCPNCWNGTVPFIKCSNPIDITQENFQSLGWYKPGKFYVAYCSGAWDFTSFGAWMVTRFPSAADQWNGSRAISVSYGDLGAYFNEDQQIGAGYATPALAAAAAAGVFVELNHPGGDISLFFTDQRYDDNVAPPSGTTPKFALYGRGLDLVDALLPLGTCSFKLGGGVWSVGFQMKNISGVPLDALSFKVSGPFTIVGTDTQAPVHFNVDQTSGVSFSINPTGGKNVSATLEVSISGTVWGTMVFDLTPTVIVSANGIGADNSCPGGTERVDVSMSVNGFGYDHMTASIRLGGDVASSIEWQTCTPKQDFEEGTDFQDFGVQPCQSFFSVDIGTSTFHPASLALTIDFKDTGTLLQTSTLTVPMLWS